MSLRPSIINLGGESVAGCSIREEGLRAAALPGRVAPADAVALDAGPRADERVGHIYQSVVGLALREQIFLRWKDEPPNGGVARVPQALARVATSASRSSFMLRGRAPTAPPAKGQRR